jgi:hypothetical protein
MFTKYGKYIPKEIPLFSVKESSRDAENMQTWRRKLSPYRPTLQIALSPVVGRAGNQKTGKEKLEVSN